MCLVTTEEKAAELGLTPLVRLVSWGSAGVGPEVMGIGPVPATEAALGKAGLNLSDIDVIELNEAFAAQALAVMREWKFTDADMQRTNVHGSGISLGHPVGATGGRMLATLARELHRRDARYGLETMCIGGGQGLAAVFERVTVTKLAQTLGLTEVQTEIISTVRQFVDKEIIPNAQELEHSDTYPQAIVDQMREMGLFGLMVPERVRRPGRVAADLRIVRRGTGPRLDERLRGDQHPLHRRLHDPPARHRRTEAALPAPDGHRRDPRRVLDVRTRTRLRRRRDPHPGPRQRRRHLHHRRPEDVADQRRQLHAGGRAGAHRRGRRQAAPQPDRVPRRKAHRLR